MSRSLPEEILKGILSWVPAKSLLACRCVSKTWNSLITSPAFISHHLKKSRARTNGLVLFRYHGNQATKKDKGKREHYLLYPAEKFPDYCLEELDCPFKSRYDYFHILGSWNGVICLYDDLLTYNNSLNGVLWNPSIRKCLTIPVPNVCHKTHGPFMHSLGFGFDSMNNDYKFVRIVYLQEDLGLGKVPPLVEVYSWRSGCWRMISNNVKHVVLNQSAPAAFVNGACHWVAHASHGNNGISSVVVLFCLETELFGDIAVPDCLVAQSYVNMTAAVLNESLSLVPFRILRGLGVEHFSVWVMREYGASESWTKLFNFQHFEGISRMFALGNNGEALLAGEDGKLVSYDPKTKKTLATKIQGTKLPSYGLDSFYLDDFVESLVLLTEVNDRPNSISQSQHNRAELSRSVAEGSCKMKKKKKIR